MSEQEHLPYLDGWRGVAIGLVLLQHFGHVRRPDVGRLGVDLFFVLSGLLMSRILFEQRMPVVKFYRRRIARIMPVFLLFVAFAWLGWSHLGASWQELATTLTFTRTYYHHPEIWRSAVPDGNLWSLNIEEQCYALLALIAAVRFLQRRASLVLFGLAALTIPAIKAHLMFAPQWDLALTTECASAGLLLSAAYYPLGKRWTVPSWMPIAALVGAVACYCGFGPWFLSLTAAPVLLAFSVNHIQESWGWIVGALRWSPLRRLGLLSYSIYLWQQLFYTYQTRFPWHTAGLLAVVAGAASYYLFELPARRWLNAHWGARIRAETAPVLAR